MKNGVYTAFRFGVYTLSGIFFIPFLVKEYGSGSYGLIALAGFLTQYVGMISGCVGSAVARYINIALNKNDWQQANEVFSTALAANSALLLIQLPLYALGVWKLNWLIAFPAEVASDFRILVGCNIIIFVLGTLFGVFYTPIQAANRVDLGAKLDVFRQICRISLLVFLIKGYGAKLWIIGVTDLGVTLLNMSMVIAIYRRLAERLKFRFEYITKKWIKPVLSMASWSLVSMLGFSLFVKTDVWILNRFVSKDVAGVYAALLVWPNFIKQVGGQLSGLIGPVYMIDFARNDRDRIGRICLFSNKVLGLFAAVAVSFVFLFSETILRLWLGSEFAEHSLLLKLMALGLILTLGESVVWGIFPAMAKTHYTGIANIVTGILNIGISFALVFLGYGVYGVAIGTLVSTVLKCALILPYAASKELGFPYARFLGNYAIAVLAFVAIMGANELLQLVSSSLCYSLTMFSATFMLAIPVFFRCCFSSGERALVWEVVKR
jgi:membrane protein EpsK